jgi:hypothetical protein
MVSSSKARGIPNQALMIHAAFPVKQQNLSILWNYERRERREAPRARSAIAKAKEESAEQGPT